MKLSEFSSDHVSYMQVIPLCEQVFQLVWEGKGGGVENQCWSAWKHKINKDENKRSATNMQLSYQQPQLQSYNFLQKWQTETWLIFFGISAKRFKSLQNDQSRCWFCYHRASWHNTYISPQNHVWHLKTPSSSGSPRGQPIRGLVVKSSPDLPGRTKQHNSVSS